MARELAFKSVAGLACFIISSLTFAWTGKGRPTMAKVWRIRRLTALKVWMYRKMPSFCRYFGVYGYLRHVAERFG